MTGTPPRPDPRPGEVAANGPRPWRSLVAPGGLAAVVRHPELWLTAARVAAVMAPPGWWHRWPPLPLPDDGYVRFRLETMFGGGPTTEGRLDPQELVAYLRWCRRLGGVAR